MKNVFLIIVSTIALIAVGNIIWSRNTNVLSATETSAIVTSAPTDTQVLSATQIPIQSVSPIPTQNLIDCTGPDGKHLQVTASECESFNKAWGNIYPYLTEEPSPTPSWKEQFDNCVNNRNQQLANDPNFQKTEADGKAQLQIVDDPNASDQDRIKAEAAVAMDNMILGAQSGGMPTMISLCGNEANQSQ